MAEVLDTNAIWTQNSLRNGDVIAAHEKTMFVLEVAMLGAAATKEHLEGVETIGETHPIEWGRIHRMGPVREHTRVSWQSKPVYLGEADKNVLGLSCLQLVLSENVTIETKTARSLKGKSKAEELIDESYTITRHLSDRATEPVENIIKDPRDHSPAYIDRNYSCNNLIPFKLWTPEEQICEYEKRIQDIADFMNSLSILAKASGAEHDLMRDLRAGHVSSQLRAISVF